MVLVYFMRCVTLHSPRKMRVERKELGGKPADDSILLRIKAIGICGSDVHAYKGTQPFQTYPRVLGHELGAEVAESGGDLEKGQRVTLEPLIRCGDCYPCQRGRYNCCTALKVIGVHADGGMCEFMWAPRNLVFPVPDSLPMHEVALCEPLAIGCQVVKRGQVTEEDDVLVIGAGPIGLLIAQVCKARGARVLVSEVDGDRLKMARQVGADLAVNPTESDLEEEIFDYSGRPPTVVLEAVGSPVTIRQSLDLVSAAGRVVIVGLYGEKMEMEPITLIRKELDVMGSRNSNGMFPVAIRLASEGKVDLGALVSHRFPLESAPSVFRKIDEGSIKPVKVVLEP